MGDQRGLLWKTWVIVLTGVKVSFYHQFPVLLHMRDDRIIYGEWYMQRLAIIVMYIIGYDYFQGQRRWTLPDLIERLHIPKGAVQDILEALEKSGLILTIDSDKTLVPAQDMETITLEKIINSVRGELPGALSPLNDFISVPGIEKIMSEMEDTINSTLSKETLKELVISHIRDNKETI